MAPLIWVSVVLSVTVNVSHQEISSENLNYILDQLIQETQGTNDTNVNIDVNQKKYLKHEIPQRGNNSKVFYFKRVSVPLETKTNETHEGDKLSYPNLKKDENSKINNTSSVDPADNDFVIIVANESGKLTNPKSYPNIVEELYSEGRLAFKESPSNNTEQKTIPTEISKEDDEAHFNNNTMLQPDVIKNNPGSKFLRKLFNPRGNSNRDIKTNRRPDSIMGDIDRSTKSGLVHDDVLGTEENIERFKFGKNFTESIKNLPPRENNKESPNEGIFDAINREIIKENIQRKLSDENNIRMFMPSIEETGQDTGLIDNVAENPKSQLKTDIWKKNERVQNIFWKTPKHLVETWPHISHQYRSEMKAPVASAVGRFSSLPCQRNYCYSQRRQPVTPFPQSSNLGTWGYTPDTDMWLRWVQFQKLKGLRFSSGLYNGYGAPPIVYPTIYNVLNV